MITSRTRPPTGALIDRYDAAWNAQDLDAIVSMHATDSSSTTTPPASARRAGTSAPTSASIFETWPDIGFRTRRLYVRDGLVTQEWTATATHSHTMRRGDIVAEPTGRTIEWRGMDVIPFENGLVKRKDVYSDSVAVLRQIGLLA